MLYSEKIKLAIDIAFEAHKDQKDKGGYPHFLHPYHIAEQMKSEDEIIVALLHDVVEDTNISLEDLKSYGFKDEILKAIDIITRKQGVKYMDYIKEIKTNKLARAVKIEDLKHNMDKSRLPENCSFSKFKTYEKAIKILID